MSISILRFVREYTDFSLFGKKIQIPYCIVKQPGELLDPKIFARTDLNLHYAAKGTPAQIKLTLIETAQKKQFSLKEKTNHEIHQFMVENGIGVDCSGFVYNVLNSYYEQNGQLLAHKIKVFPGFKGEVEKFFFSRNRVRRCSAETLTNDLNSIPITKVEEIMPGDLIRFTLPTWRGKHVAIITKVSKHKIWYAHSAERSKQKGPHLASISIVNPKKGIMDQVWHEKLGDGTSYKAFSFHPEKGDSVRRLRSDKF